MLMLHKFDTVISPFHFKEKWKTQKKPADYLHEV